MIKFNEINADVCVKLVSAIIGKGGHYSVEYSRYSDKDDSSIDGHVLIIDYWYAAEKRRFLIQITREGLVSTRFYGTVSIKDTLAFAVILCQEILDNGSYDILENISKSSVYEEVSEKEKG